MVTSEGEASEWLEEEGNFLGGLKCSGSPYAFVENDQNWKSNHFIV